MANALKNFLQESYLANNESIEDIINYINNYGIKNKPFIDNIICYINFNRFFCIYWSNCHVSTNIIVSFSTIFIINF